MFPTFHPPLFDSFRLSRCDRLIYDQADADLAASLAGAFSTGPRAGRRFVSLLTRPVRAVLGHRARVAAGW